MATPCCRFQAGKLLLLMTVASWILFTLPVGFIHPPVVSCKFWNGSTYLLQEPGYSLFIHPFSILSQSLSPFSEFCLYFLLLLSLLSFSTLFILSLPTQVSLSLSTVFLLSPPFIYFADLATLFLSSVCPFIFHPAFFSLFSFFFL